MVNFNYNRLFGFKQIKRNKSRRCILTIIHVLFVLDAFAKVIFTHFIAETRVIWETRSPTWDQTIIFEDIYLWGDVNEIAVNPPTIVLEIFDKDIGVRIRL